MQIKETAALLLKLDQKAEFHMQKVLLMTSQERTLDRILVHMLLVIDWRDSILLSSFPPPCLSLGIEQQTSSPREVTSCCGKKIWMVEEKFCFCLGNQSIILVVQSLSHVQLFCNPIDYSPQAPLSMEFFRQEYWSGLPFASPGQLPDQGIKHAPPALAGGFCTTEPLGKPKRLS